MAFKFLAGPNLWCLPWDSPTCNSASTSSASATSPTVSTASSAASACTHHFFLSRFSQWARTGIIFASVLEEFAHLPEFVLVSMIVSIRYVQPNQCLGVTLFSYFRFLFVTCKNYGVKRQGNLLTKILLSRQFASTSVRQYVSTSVCQYVSMSVRQYVSMPLCSMAAVHQYVSTSVRHVT